MLSGEGPRGNSAEAFHGDAAAGAQVCPTKLTLCPPAPSALTTSETGLAAVRVALPA